MTPITSEGQAMNTTPSQDARALLTEDERAFLKHVFRQPGAKLNDFVEVTGSGREVWDRPEALGLVRCVGSFKWEPVDEDRLLAALAQPATPATYDDGWLQDGPMLYRLTDDRRPTNRDEIRVTMADGSHSQESCTRRAGELLERIRAAPAAEDDKRDAERYRWLRLESRIAIAGESVIRSPLKRGTPFIEFPNWIRAGDFRAYDRPEYRNNFDAAIDAAMQATKETN